MAQDVSDVVLIIHGIRDFGRWTSEASKIFRTQGVEAFPVKYGYYDVLSFLSPVQQSDRPYEKLVKQYQAARETFPTARISIVAHSFGTFLVGRLLDEFPCENLNRIILCGAVLPRDFDWQNVKLRFQFDRNCCLNECGASDYWPVIAESLKKRYGSAGRNGFFDEIVTTNQWYLGGHNTFFKRQHMSHWGAFIKSGTLPPVSAVAPPPSFLEKLIATVPLLRLLIAFVIDVIWFVFAFWYLIIALVGVLVAIAWLWEPDPRPIVLSNVLTTLENTSESLQDEESWNRFVEEGFLKEYMEYVEFEAIITRIEDQSNDTLITIVACPANCDWLQKTKAMELRITIAKNKVSVSRDLLLPSEIGYTKARFRGRFDNIVRRGNGGGRVFFVGEEVEIELDKIECP